MIWLCWPLLAPGPPPILGLCRPVPLASSQSPPHPPKLVPETPSTSVTPPQPSYRGSCVFCSLLDPQLREAAARCAVTLPWAWGSSWHKGDTQATSVGKMRPPGCRPPVSACIVLKRAKAPPGSGQQEAGTGAHWGLLGGGQAKPWRVPQAWKLSRAGPLEPASHSLSAPSHSRIWGFLPKTRLKSPGVRGCRACGSQAIKTRFANQASRGSLTSAGFAAGVPLTRKPAPRARGSTALLLRVLNPPPIPRVLPPKYTPRAATA